MASAGRGAVVAARPVHLHERAADVERRAARRARRRRGPTSAASVAAGGTPLAARRGGAVRAVPAPPAGGRGCGPGRAPRATRTAAGRRSGRWWRPARRLRLAQLGLALGVDEPGLHRGRLDRGRGCPSASQWSSAVELGDGGVEHVRAAGPLHRLVPRRRRRSSSSLVEEEGDHRLDLGEQPHPLLHERRQRLRARPTAASPRVRNGPGPLDELVGRRARGCSRR